MTHWRRREELLKQYEEEYEKEKAEELEADLEKAREIRRLLDLINQYEPRH